MIELREIEVETSEALNVLHSLLEDHIGRRLRMNYGTTEDDIVSPVATFFGSTVSCFTELDLEAA